MWKNVGASKPDRRVRLREHGCSAFKPKRNEWGVAWRER